MTTRTTRRGIEADDELLRYEEDTTDFSVEFDNSTVDKDDLLTSQSIPSPLASDYDERLQAAQQQLQALREQQDEIERQKQELEELNQKQRSFVSGRSDLSNKFSRSIATLEREAAEARKRAETFDETREDFEKHFETINALKPEEWDRAELKTDLTRALTLIDDARDDFDKQMSKVNSLRHHVSAPADSPAVSSGSPRREEPAPATKALPTNFKQCFLLGLAFTLPLIILGTVGLVVTLIF